MTDTNSVRLEGLEVVSLVDTPGKRYELNVAALEQVLLRPDVRDIPVVVVSVSGAYRGGKSFILDFFLRYLTASRSSQLNGEWLDDDRKLEGFAWRGGSDRHTTGIHLWPEPVIVTLQNDEKVAVLLMDTQGTFDHESTLGDNSTIFALSVLISSIQIYNLSGNIREDDLQHLQLFTEYGRVASDGKAFQKLIFLVRDWLHPNEHAYGYDGGEAVLNKRLEVKANQMKELREVREHLRSCFETMKCFLMPHPGLVVREVNFEGRVKDLEKEFREALLKLVPSLFEPQNLVPKLMSGESVKAKHLLEYFKNYVEIFNSNELPEAVTIFQATADACMAAALRDSQDLYQERMEHTLRNDLSVTSCRLQHLHNDAMEAARALFNDKKKLGSQESVEAARTRLNEELGARLSVYNLQNEAKTAKSIATAKNVYENIVNNVCGQQTLLCLHPRDLERLHERALNEALQSFDKTRVMEGQEDEDRQRLEKDLKQLYDNLCSTNEHNNQSAILKCREVFETKMKTQLNGACVSEEVLGTYHNTALQQAINEFKSTRNIDTEETVDAHLDRLIQEVDGIFKELNTRNTKSNRVAIQGAEYTYQSFMSSAWGTQASCFHPKALEELHNAGQEKALQHFNADRPESQNDAFQQNLIELIASRYKELVRVNEVNNNLAVENALTQYIRLMNEQQPGAPAGGNPLAAMAPAAVILPMAMGSPVTAVAGAVLSVAASIFGRKKKPKGRPLSERHQVAKNGSIQVWESFRRGGPYCNDPYKEQLEKKIESTLNKYS